MSRRSSSSSGKTAGLTDQQGRIVREGLELCFTHRELTEMWERGIQLQRGTIPAGRLMENCHQRRMNMGVRADQGF